MLTDRSRTPSPERPDNTKKSESSGHQCPHHQDFTYHPPESSQRHDRANKLRISTFDSGFGGFFTAKAIEREARKIHEKYDIDISISHYGDTKNAPYGEKSPRSIASLTTKGVEHILSQQSDMVFVACNTASTQYETVKENRERKMPGHGDRVISIIDKTVDHVSHIIRDRMKQEDTIHLAFLATPATIKSGSYPRKLASQLGGTLHVGQLQTFNQERWHKESGVEIECNKKKENNQVKERSTPLQRSEIQASITISGENIEQTKNLADTIFPSEIKTTVTQFQNH